MGKRKKSLRVVDRLLLFMMARQQICRRSQQAWAVRTNSYPGVEAVGPDSDKHNNLKCTAKFNFGLGVSCPEIHTYGVFAMLGPRACNSTPVRMRFSAHEWANTSTAGASRLPLQCATPGVW